MLTEFEGTINARGLCSFRESRESRSLSDLPAKQSGLVAFWAVLELTSAIDILNELKTGGRSRALRLLEEVAVSLGTL